VSARGFVSILSQQITILTILTQPPHVIAYREMMVAWCMGSAGEFCLLLHITIAG
jgi:hypothetical protein